MKNLLVYALILLVAGASAAVALAQDAGPCTGDVARFCANIQPGEGRIADCLKQNEDRLSPACKAQHLAEVGEALRQTQQACGDDSVKFCGSYLQQQGYPLLECLKLNSTGLSPECRSKLFEALEQMHY